jgi:hypothetical protein
VEKKTEVQTGNNSARADQQEPQHKRDQAEDKNQSLTNLDARRTHTGIENRTAKQVGVLHGKKKKL